MLTETPLRALWPPIALLLLSVAVLPAALWIGWYWLATLAAFGCAVLPFDIRGRGYDYRKAGEFLAQGADPAQIAKTYQFSWCTRVACLAAARDAGGEARDGVEAYYSENGYRWFHVFPDKTFSRESPFLKAKFWRVTLLGNLQAASIIEKKAERSDSRTVIVAAFADRTDRAEMVRRKAA